MVIFARDSKCAGRLSEAFRNRNVEKVYLLICKGRFSQKEGYVRNFILWKEEKRKAEISDSKDYGKEAITYYEVLEEYIKICH